MAHSLGAGPSGRLLVVEPPLGGESLRAAWRSWLDEFAEAEQPPDGVDAASIVAVLREVQGETNGLE